MPGAIKVTQLSLSATESLVGEFFSFSGEIESVKLTPGETGGTQSAIVVFKDAKSVETALLLTGAVIVDKPVAIDPISLPDAGHGSGTGGMGAELHETHDAPPRMEGAAQSTMTRMLAKGYVLGGDAMDQAKALDEKYKGTSTIKAKVNAVDEKLGISQKTAAATAVVNKQLKAVDDRYQVSDKAKAVVASAEKTMSDLSNKAMQNPTVNKSVGWLKDSFKKVTNSVTFVHAAATEKAAETRAMRTGHDHEGAPPPPEYSVLPGDDHFAGPAHSSAPVTPSIPSHETPVSYPVVSKDI